MLSSANQPRRLLCAPKPLISTRGCLRSRARSADVTITAPAPSLRIVTEAELSAVVSGLIARSGFPIRLALTEPGRARLQVAAPNAEAAEQVAQAFRAELDRGYFAMVSTGEGHAEQVKELPVDAETVILRLPISGG